VHSDHRDHGEDDSCHGEGERGHARAFRIVIGSRRARIVDRAGFVLLDHIPSRVGVVRNMLARSQRPGTRPGNPRREGVVADDIVRAHAFVHGRVQGVWFRQSTADRARALGVSGRVRNLPDGGVEAVFEGPSAAVAEAIDFVRVRRTPRSRLAR
jgi:acylphosphatase